MTEPDYIVTISRPALDEWRANDGRNQFAIWSRPPTVKQVVADLGIPLRHAVVVEHWVSALSICESHQLDFWLWSEPP